MEDCIQFTQKDIDIIQENERNNGDINPFLIFSDCAPIDLLNSLFLYFSEKTRDEALLRSYYILYYNYVKNKLNGSLSEIIDTFVDQSNSHERRYFSLTLLHEMIELTPNEEELDIAPDFINLLIQYFPHSLAICVCNDLIKRDASYYQYFVQMVLEFDESSSQSHFISFNNFFLSLMQDNLYDTLLLLQSFLQCKENLIYMKPTFHKILEIISSCEIKDKIECFNVLSKYFDCDDLYYSEFISSKNRASSIFAKLEEDPLLIESSLNFANEITNSNNEETLQFIKITKLDQMIVNILPLVNNNQIMNLCCKICERVVQSKRKKGISFLLKSNIISFFYSLKESISFISYKRFMHLASKCIIKGSKSQVVSTLSMIPLAEFAQYASVLDKEEAVPFLKKISDTILLDFETNKNEIIIDEKTYKELVDLSNQESEEEDQITVFLDSISPLFKQSELDNENDS